MVIQIFVGWAMRTLGSNSEFQVIGTAHPTVIENGEPARSWGATALGSQYLMRVSLRRYLAFGSADL
ncbi:hypothetical protein [Brasilonema bromeliae]|uniref:Uncharacterized protein n=1 Tax=Brasilonema bromeliae SPC951 TaxID=385972 RepID=A0ABX1PAN8_9CYAN|nr:hypothetical protein [Brasilonema bromeliae]NMG21426.1 hypothetical protein [Brasilonema bromeliae SPC951]